MIQMALTERQHQLIDAFAETDGVVTEAGRELVIGLIRDQIIEFAHPETEHEHLHVPHPADEHAVWCGLCDAIERGLV